MSMRGEHPNMRDQRYHFFLQEGYGVNVAIISIGRSPPHSDTESVQGPHWGLFSFCFKGVG